MSVATIHSVVRWFERIEGVSFESQMTDPERASWLVAHGYPFFEIQDRIAEAASTPASQFGRCSIMITIAGKVGEALISDGRVKTVRERRRGRHRKVPK